MPLIKSMGDMTRGSIYGGTGIDVRDPFYCFRYGIDWIRTLQGVFASPNEDATVNLFDSLSSLLYQCLPLNTAAVNTSLYYYFYDDIIEFISTASTGSALLVYVFFGVELLGDVLKHYFSITGFLPEHYDMFNFFSFASRLINSATLLLVLGNTKTPF